MKIPISFAIITLFLLSCSSAVVFQSSEMVPAATGTAKFKKMDNGNFNIQVSVKGLAPADKLKSKKRDHFVVWVDSDKGTYNLGELEHKEDLSGSLSAESTYKPKRILISLEKDIKADKPDKPIVLKSEKF